MGMGQAMGVDHGVMTEKSTQVISLSLNSPEEMFVLAPADLFSEYRNFMTGLEYCISMLRSRRSNGSVRIELALPADQLSREWTSGFNVPSVAIATTESPITNVNVGQPDSTACSRYG